MTSEINGVDVLNSSTSQPSTSIENNQSDMGKAAPTDPQVKATGTGLDRIRVDLGHFTF
jgi:hypothetical protein